MFPRCKKAGLPDFDGYSLFGLFAPARTSADVIKKIHEDITENTQRPDVKRALEARSLDVQGKTGSEFQAIINRDIVKGRKVITTANIKDE
jgi:tripartite-type tricarboxylate transporter receptor subunit TctC